MSTDIELEEAEGAAVAIVTALLNGEYDHAAELLGELLDSPDKAARALDRLAWASVTLTRGLASALTALRRDGDPVTEHEVWQRYTLVVARVAGAGDAS